MFLSIRLAKIKTFENIILVKRRKKSHIAGGSTDQNNLCYTFSSLENILVRHLKNIVHKIYSILCGLLVIFRKVVIACFYRILFI